MKNKVAVRFRKGGEANGIVLRTGLLLIDSVHQAPVSLERERFHRGQIVTSKIDDIPGLVQFPISQKRQSKNGIHEPANL